MALSYAPFDDSAPGVPKAVPKELLRRGPLPEVDGTECNYLVMFFVGGVFLMALVDTMRD